MNKREIIIFIAGIGIGAISTYFILNKRYENIANEEIESVKKQFSKYNDKKEKEKNERTIKIINDYARNNFKETDWEVKDENMMAENEHPRDDENENKYLIDLDEYTRDDKYDKITCEFYPENHVLINVDDNSMMDIEENIGESNLVNFGGSFEDFDDTMFIRNERLGIDFEVVRCDGEYVEE